MGKKAKSKGRNPRKAQAGSAQSGTGAANLKEDAEVQDVKCGEQCSHYSKDNAEFTRILSGILSSKISAACEHCREDALARKSKKSKQQKKREEVMKSAAAGSEFFWVCLHCNLCFCGGTVSDTVPHGHARRHFKQDPHALVVRLDNPCIAWCFLCNLAISVECPCGAADVGEVKSVAGDKSVEVGVTESLTLEDVKGYMIRGLSNLGNTCFFNSVMQNLLAIDMLRDYMVNLDISIGPLTMSLKKLFNETNVRANNKGVLSPRNLFASICFKAPQFKGYQQQDSHELLRYLLDGLYVEERTFGKEEDSSNDQVSQNSNNTAVDNIFGGELSSTVCCIECGHTSIVCEPFLDLSLPVPSKKTTHKKVVNSSPKRSKPPLKERNKSRRFREKGSARGSVVMEQYGSEERVTSSVEFTESYGPVSRPEENSTCVTVIQKSEKNIVSEPEESSWMDYLAEPNIMSDDLNLDSQSCDNLNFHGSDSGQIIESENNISVKSEVDNSPSKLNVSPDSFCENSSKNDTSSSVVHDSEIALYPNETLDYVTNTMAIVTSETPDNMSSSQPLVKEPPVQIATAVDSELAEVDFDGFGDLFNEPEVTSELKTDTGTAEEMAVAFNSSETIQEEVDNSNAPVSIESCLALFTNMELLSNEHAWYCDHCSEVSSTDMMTTDKTCKSDALTNLESSKTMMLQDNAEHSRNGKKFNSKVDCLNSADENICNEETTSICAETEPLSEKPGSKPKLLDIVGDSEKISCKHEEIITKDNLVLMDSQLCDQTCKPDVMIGFRKLADSGPEQTSGKCNETTDGKEEAQSDGHASLTSFPSVGENLSNSCRNSALSVNHVRRKGPKLSSQDHPAQDRVVKIEEPAKKKVKRDATKRILINKTPPVLTIHLKRFSQDTRGRLSKMRGHIRFQDTLDLRPYLDPRCNERENCTYRLLGVVEHSGNMSNGHYVAYVRGAKKDGKASIDANSSVWFYASDAHVKEVSFSEVLQSEAYILFYERRI